MKLENLNEVNNLVGEKDRKEENLFRLKHGTIWCYELNWAEVSPEVKEIIKVVLVSAHEAAIECIKKQIADL